MDTNEQEQPDVISSEHSLGWDTRYAPSSDWENDFDFTIKCEI